MKRYLYLIVCSFTILLSVFALVKINTNVKTEYQVEKVLVGQRNIVNNVKKTYDNIERNEKEKQEKLKKERIEKERKNKEIQARKANEKNTVVKTSIEKLYIQQLTHYITTYGFEELDIYSKLAHTKLSVL